MKNFILTLIIVIVIILVIVSLPFIEIAVDSFNPLRQSEEKIRESILGVTPIGMSMDDVVVVVESKKEWSNLRKNYERGVVYDKRVGRPTDSANYVEKLSNQFDIIGKKSMHVLMGYYPEFLFQAYVGVWWAFDEDSKLIDVIIGKEYSGF